MTTLSPSPQLDDTEANLGLPTPPGKVGNALRSLWEANDAATRASLMNLAIYSESPGALLDNTRCVEELTREHACRVILIEAHPEASKRSSEAWVRAHCSLGSDGHKAVCCEQLAFRMYGDSPARLTNLLFANVESDLPLTLWWQAPLGERFDLRIYGRIERLIVDSEIWTSPEASLDALVAAHENRLHHFVIHDLSWTRTFHLRLAIAGGFEDSIALEALDQLESIELVHHPDYPMTARLLGAWLTERLSQQGRTAPPLHFSLAHDSPGPLMRVSFVTAKGAFSIDRADEHFYRWQDPNAKAPHLFPIDPVALPALLMDQLSRGGQTTSYLRMVRRLIRTPWARESSPA